MAGIEGFPTRSAHWINFSSLIYQYFMAGIEGFEPPMPDSESGALPLGDIPKLLTP